MTAATSTVPDVLLDQQTRDEMQPPCESKRRDGNPAVLVVQWIGCEHFTHSLHCDECVNDPWQGIRVLAARGVIRCLRCNAPIRLLSVEPI